MSEHAFGEATLNATGASRSVTCSCGTRLSAQNVEDLDRAMTSHLVDVGEAPPCRVCLGELVDWSSTRDYVPAEDGMCGRCRLERMGPMELGRRRGP